MRKKTEKAKKERLVGHLRIMQIWIETDLKNRKIGKEYKRVLEWIINTIEYIKAE